MNWFTRQIPFVRKLLVILAVFVAFIVAVCVFDRPSQLSAGLRFRAEAAERPDAGMTTAGTTDAGRWISWGQNSVIRRVEPTRIVFGPGMRAYAKQQPDGGWLMQGCGTPGMECQE